MPDLPWADDIFIDAAPPKISVSAVKVQNLTTLSVNTGDVELSFPSLESAQFISLAGNILK